MGVLLQFLSLSISLYFAYVFVSYADEMQRTPNCNMIDTEKRELIKLYGYFKMFFAGLAMLLFLYLVVFGPGPQKSITFGKMRRRR